MTVFQPVLFNGFHTADAIPGLHFLIVAMFPLVAPLLVSILSPPLNNGQICFIDLALELISLALFHIL